MSAGVRTPLCRRSYAATKARRRAAEAKEGAVRVETILRDSPIPLDVVSGSLMMNAASCTKTGRSEHPAVLERTVNYVLDDCFFTVGQVVGTRKALEYDA